MVKYRRLQFFGAAFKTFEIKKIFCEPVVRDLQPCVIFSAGRFDLYPKDSNGNGRRFGSISTSKQVCSSRLVDWRESQISLSQVRIPVVGQKSMSNIEWFTTDTVRRNLGRLQTLAKGNTVSESRLRQIEVIFFQ